MKLPDGPRSPSLVQTLQWMFNPLDYLEDAAKRYGDIFTAYIGTDFAPIVLVSDPQAIQRIFTGESKQFGFAKQQQKIIKPLVGENSVLMLDGDRHRRHRQLLMPPFHGKRMRVYGQMICDITTQVMNQLPVEQTFVARKVMQEISLEVMLQAVFGLDEGERAQKLRQILISWLDVLGSPIKSSFLVLPFLQKDLGSWSPWGYFSRLKQQLKAVLYTEIAERRQHYEPDRGDIFTLLLSARDENGEAMTDEELHDDLLVLLVTGYEITAVAMTWALYWAHSLADVGNQILEELDTLGLSKDPISISQLPYLTAVCRETLRLYPVAIGSSARLVTSPVEFGSHKLDTGTMVMPCIYLTHHRQDLYPNSKQFRPERFLERQFSPYEYLPFGGGNRSCIGATFGMFEMKLVLATILSEYRLALSENQTVHPQYQTFMLAPAGGVKMIVKKQGKTPSNLQGFRIRKS